ncbi:uncharacterized protein EI97DRAFT_439466 [Westerdykella ornata]|uniref:Uncharacterized protein n=1 Tax=Westerdykella ornata TaxID=318751 RepID=A0A6A6JWJ6_WESOR|nr:uncharacterized protein EI97DRAFT_439466 [Westerdykella ornata]KAF2280453.1 hypothetical protein EI97DRAFT_439466 [Westerdykella ornata]
MRGISRDAFLKDPYFLVESKKLPKWTSETTLSEKVTQSLIAQPKACTPANRGASKLAPNPLGSSNSPTDEDWDAVSHTSASGSEDNGTTAMQAESREIARLREHAAFRTEQTQRRRDQVAINSRASMDEQQREQKRLKRKEWYESGGEVETLTVPRFNDVTETLIIDCAAQCLTAFMVPPTVAQQEPNPSSSTATQPQFLNTTGTRRIPNLVARTQDNRSKSILGNMKRLLCCSKGFVKEFDDPTHQRHPENSAHNPEAWEVEAKKRVLLRGYDLNGHHLGGLDDGVKVRDFAYQEQNSTTG